MAETDPGLDDALRALWERARPRVDARLDVLDEASGALRGPGLGDEQRDGARTAAHQLAGLLGTLGLPAASPVAKRLEHLLTGAPSTEDAAALDAGIAELRAAAEVGPTG